MRDLLFLVAPMGGLIVLRTLAHKSSCAICSPGYRGF
jgi:hypothetical protein